MAKRSKKYREALTKFEKEKEYSVAEAVDILKSMTATSFDSTVESHFRINYKTMQNVRGSIQLPHGTGKQIKVLVFTKGEKAEEAKKAGADYVGDTDLIQKVADGWLDFDFVVSTPDMMKDVGKLGPVLGKKGLMPKPKAGTVTNNVAAIVEQLKSGRVEYRADKTGVVHLGMGKISFSPEKLVENALAAYSAVIKAKPSDAKGEFVATVYLSGTMTPGVKINVKELKA